MFTPQACRDFLDVAESHSRRWQKALQYEREQRHHLEETIEQLAKQHNNLERAWRENPTSYTGKIHHSLCLFLSSSLFFLVWKEGTVSYNITEKECGPLLDVNSDTFLACGSVRLIISQCLGPLSTRVDKVKIFVFEIVRGVNFTLDFLPCPCSFSVLHMVS